MYEGFEELGYQVDRIWGSAEQRREQIRTVKDKLASGVHYDFAYSETSTMPTLATECHHLPTTPLVDYSLFRLLQTSGIPLGLFYRDVYWRFELYRRNTQWYKRLVTVPLYHLDLIVYRYLVDVLFLPSLRMSRHISHWPRRKPVYALPPGGVLYDTGANESDKPELRLFYVGGVGPPLYDIGNLLEAVYRAVKAGSRLLLTICCPETAWLQRPSEYDSWLGDWLSVVHLSGERLQALYEIQDVAVIYRMPSPYLEFAMPVKLFEALGHGKPILTMNGTVVSEFVQENQCGWSVEPDPASLANLLQHLVRRPEKVRKAEEVSRCLRLDHTWAKRAEKVASILCSVGTARR
jgi:glycosyltransferase involved in cell wall biosynthesis